MRSAESEPLRPETRRNRTARQCGGTGKQSRGNARQLGAARWNGTAVPHSAKQRLSPATLSDGIATQGNGSAVLSRAGGQCSNAVAKLGAATLRNSSARRRMGRAQQCEASAEARRSHGIAMPRSASNRHSLSTRRRGTAGQSGASARSGDWRTPRNLIWRHLHVHCRST